MASKKLTETSIIITILVSITVLFLNINTISGIINNFFNNNNNQNNEIPFYISIDPTFIQEGQYLDYDGWPQKIPIKFTLILSPNKNR